MYAVTAWMVLIITCLLVGTQMNEEKLNQNPNPKPEMLSEQQNEEVQQQQNEEVQQQQNKEVQQQQNPPTRSQLLYLKFLKNLDKKSNPEQQKSAKKVSKVLIKKQKSQFMRKKKLKKMISNKRLFNDVITDPLCFAITSEYRGYVEPLRSRIWPSFKSDLMNFIKDYCVENAYNRKPRYDTTEIHRGFRIIKCMNEFSKQIFKECFGKLCENWPGQKLKFIPAKNIPKGKILKPVVPEQNHLNRVRPLSEVITDPLCFALAGERHGHHVPVCYQWPSIESEFMQHVYAYNATNTNGHILDYDTNEVHRGFRIIKCMNEISKEFLQERFKEICNSCSDMHLKLLPACDLPRKPIKPVDMNLGRKLSNLPSTSRETFSKEEKPAASPPPPHSSVRPFSEVITDPLCFALTGKRRRHHVPVRYQWPSIESEFMQQVNAYNATNTNGHLLQYDTNEFHRGFRLIKCMNEVSKVFLRERFKAICKNYRDIRLSLLPARDIPKNPKRPIDMNLGRNLSNLPSTSRETVSKEEKPAAPPPPPPHSSVRPFREVIKDPLCFTLAGELRGRDLPVRYQWPSIESEFMQHVNAYNATNASGHILEYDTNEVHRGFRLIKCMNEISKEFLQERFKEICENYREIHLKLLPACDLPKKPRDSIDKNLKRKLGNLPSTFGKEQQPVAPPPPSWSDNEFVNNKFESLNEEEKYIEWRRQSNVIESKRRRETDQDSQASRTTSASYMNPFRGEDNVGFQLTKNYDSTDESSSSYMQPKKMRESFVTKPQSQQEYTNIIEKYLNTNSEFKSTKTLETRRNQTYTADSHTSSNYYDSSASTSRAAYQNPKPNFDEISTRPAFLFNSNLSATEEVNYRPQFKKDVPENFPSNYRPTFETEVPKDVHSNYMTPFEKEVPDNFHSNYRPTFQREVPKDFHSNFRPTMEEEVPDNLHSSYRPTFESEVPDNFHSNYRPPFEKEIPDNLHSNYRPPFKEEVPDNFHSNYRPPFEKEIPDNLHSNYRPPFEEKVSENVYSNYGPAFKEKVPENVYTNYRPPFEEDDLFSRNTSRHSKAFRPASPTEQDYSFRHHQSHRLRPRNDDDDELPPPPPTLKNVDDIEYDRERSRRSHIRSYWK